MKRRVNKKIIFNSNFFKTLKIKLQTSLDNQKINFLENNKESFVDRFTTEIHIPKLISIVPYFKAPLKVYWKSRDESLSAFVLGSVYSIKQNLIEDTHAFLMYSGYYDFRFYGALPFEASRNLRGKWRGFKKVHFFLPRFEFLQKKSTCLLHIYFLPNKIHELWRDFDNFEKKFQFSTIKKKEALKVFIKKQTPNWSKWAKLVNLIKEKIQEGIIDKLVLARLVEGRLNQFIDISWFIQECAENLKENYIFFFQNGNDSFLSFSPEQLFQVKNDIITTEAVAGSDSGVVHQKKNRLDHHVMSHKNIKEQEIVEKEILKRIQVLSNDIYSSQKKNILDLGYIRHIKSSFNAVMRKFYNLSELLKLFHPTSAVCGMPRDAAKQLISKLECFQRGLYAAPCGFFSAMEAEFSVGIRSMLIRGKKVYFFSGAGIVGESSPDKEWEELNYKLRPFQKIFNFDKL